MRVSSCSGLAESAVLLHTVGVGRHFLDRFDIGRKPGQPVDGMLFSFDFVRAGLPFPLTRRRTASSAQSRRPRRRVGLAGEVVERQRVGLLQLAPLLRRSMRCGMRDCKTTPCLTGREYGIPPVALAAGSGQIGRVDGGSSEGARRPENRLAGGGEVRGR